MKTNFLKFSVKKKWKIIYKKTVLENVLKVITNNFAQSKNGQTSFYRFTK